MKILGHRGYPEKYVENTIDSFKAAIDYGADGVELDVYMTLDEKIVVTHDSNLRRVFNVDLEVTKSFLKEIKEVAPVPELIEVFNVLPKEKLINVEIKDKEKGEKIVEYVIENKKHDIIFSSFEHEIILKCVEKYKDEKFGLLFDERHQNLSFEDIRELFENHNIYSAHLPIDLLYIDKEKFFSLVKYLKKIEKKIVFWTVNKIEEVEVIKDFADIIITNSVEKMVGYIKK
ncbi:glycerophosphodiester phosphodiesterase [Thermosipho africanus Ob7]|jgi:glycerophosphoryl diester phosphodiesterase|uniref:Glycerophosphodiester phosphodiesterase n=1 Tax=Thermosipho africanus (strain TCF52B) TaxID=484019 RepID=B7ID57_THEAB|nr:MULTISPECIES: glycerophosphodiester phosphodiesterase family protein [Thermosipho]HCF38833.1 glycerophosphodiester phosphodiesterase [Thermosipho africanus]ACJ75934.1 glycerophosphodiester phosphodiesterase [Thermosipho africanus TCF52B]MBZ4651082.1 glycerophosphodiester phosphodiesterase [Thermosipho sp. (in: thermotogales)]MDK2838873.1 glycerophosphoryl diester phosphodiesterase [Thermosipho sp. (in: thermotogales)]MDK2901027.1 glycerophosphoryl diester phosphodiesterase [Thermosipho sp. 